MCVCLLTLIDFDCCPLTFEITAFSKYKKKSSKLFIILFALLQKTTKFKQMLNSQNLEFIMEAHNGISARIVQEAGTCFH